MVYEALVISFGFDSITCMAPRENLGFFFSDRALVVEFNLGHFSLLCTNILFLGFFWNSYTKILIHIALYGVDMSFQKKLIVIALFDLMSSKQQCSRHV